MTKKQDEDSPLQMPRSDVQMNPEPDPVDFTMSSMDVEANVASAGQRLGNLLLDYVFMSVLTAPFFFLLTIIIALTGGDGGSTSRAIDAIPDVLFGILMFMFYYVPLEALTGRTIAKFITKTRVVSEDGDSISFMQVIGRTLCRFIPFEPFSFLGGDAVGWHDKLSKTRVITTKYLK